MVIPAPRQRFGIFASLDQKPGFFPSLIRPMAAHERPFATQFFAFQDQMQFSLVETLNGIAFPGSVGSDIP